MRFEGTLKSWDDERGFGFIEPLQGGQAVFVHVTAFGRQPNRPPLGQMLLFEVELGPTGKKRAKHVVVVRQAQQSTRNNPKTRQPRELPAKWGAATLLAIPLFLGVCLAISIFWKPPLVLAMVYVGTSVVAFLAYWRDKSAAIRNSRRTSESTLHALALAGGWPGALLAQQFLRHKSTKAAFRSVFWTTVLLNTSALLFVCSPHGRRLLALW